MMSLYDVLRTVNQPSTEQQGELLYSRHIEPSHRGTGNPPASNINPGPMREKTGDDMNLNECSSTTISLAA